MNAKAAMPDRGWSGQGGLTGLRVQNLKPLKGTRSVPNPKFASFRPRVPKRTLGSKDTRTLKTLVWSGSESRLKCQPME
jgi:hypothetical protein